MLHPDKGTEMCLYELSVAEAYRRRGMLRADLVTRPVGTVVHTPRMRGPARRSICFSPRPATRRLLPASARWGGAAGGHSGQRLPSRVRQVFGPTTPSISSLWFFWKATTADLVFVPKPPSTARP